MYVPESRELTVEFASGRRYVYCEVPFEIFTGMKSSFSKGDYFNAHVREHFRFVRADDNSQLSLPTKR